MPTHTARRLSLRTIRTCLAVAAAASPAAAAFGTTNYTLYTPGLYDSSGSVGSHIANGGASNQTLSYFNTAGGVAGTAARYTSNTITYNASGATAGNNAWYFDPSSNMTFTIGDTGAGYTAANGTQTSILKGMDDSGDVAGTSTQYLSGSNAGATAWIYVAPHNTSSAANIATGTTLDIRLAGDANISYTKGAGTANGSASAEASSIVAMNSSGVVVGASARYSAANTALSEGTSTWISRALIGAGGVSASTTRIGLTGSAYGKTTDANFQSSSVAGVNANGQAAGTSVNYSVNPSGYSDAWFYSTSGGTQIIGLSNLPSTDRNYALTGNYVSSTITLVPTNGGVAGSSATSVGGTTSWVYNITNSNITNSNNTTSGNTTVVGLAGTAVPNSGSRGYYYGGATNSSTAYQSSTLNVINASGQAVGYQSIYGVGATSTTLNNQDAFFYNGNTTQIVGLTSANYTNTSNAPGAILRTDAVTLLNDNGQMAGTSALFKAGVTIGRDAWIYSQGQLSDTNGNFGTPIGLYYSTTAGFDTSPYTNSVTGARISTVNRINILGQVAGTSTRYLSDGSGSAGTDAYLYTPGGTSVQIGLFGDAAHSYATPGNTGTIQISAIVALNPTGLVAGTSTRYTSAGSTNGTDAWLFDSTSNTTYPMALPNSVSPTTGAAQETVQFLSDKGVMLGSYTKYDSVTGAVVGTFAYAFSETMGVMDLGLNVASLSDAGWQQLDTTVTANLNGDIVGYGTLANNSIPYAAGANQQVYLLKQLLLGDANSDGKVDVDDLQIVLNHLGMTSSLRSDGNFDGNATIDLNDLDDVLNNFGLGTTTPTSTVAAEELVNGSLGQVPEPASLGILALGGVVVLRRRRRG